MVAKMTGKSITPALAVLACFSGCMSLSKPKLSAQPQGQTIAEGHRLQKATESVVQSTKRTGSNLVSQVKRALPGKSAKQTIINPIAKHDPTRLDNVPKNISPDLYVAAARLAERNGRFQKAYEQYDMALKQDGEDRDALIGLARLQHRAGDTEAAIGVYRDALNIYRNDAVIMNDLGLCYARAGKLKEAISVLGAATQAAPDRELYVNNLASCLVEADRPGEAVAHLSRMQGPAKANYNVGYMLDQRGRRSEAEQHLRQALAMEPNMYQARALLDKTQRLSSQPQVQPRTAVRQAMAPPSRPSQSPDLRTPQRFPGSAPSVTPSSRSPDYLQERSPRRGPFGYLPPASRQYDAQLVSYEEPAE